MPTLTIRTNLTPTAIPSDFLARTSKLISEIIGKPEKVITGVKLKRRNHDNHAEL